MRRTRSARDNGRVERRSVDAKTTVPMQRIRQRWDKSRAGQTWPPCATSLTRPRRPQVQRWRPPTTWPRAATNIQPKESMPAHFASFAAPPLTTYLAPPLVEMSFFYHPDVDFLSLGGLRVRYRERVFNNEKADTAGPSCATH